MWGNPIAGKHVGSALRPHKENCPEEIWASLVLLLPELLFPFSFLNVGVLGDLLTLVSYIRTIKFCWETFGGTGKWFTDGTARSIKSSLNGGAAFQAA